MDRRLGFQAVEGNKNGFSEMGFGFMPIPQEEYFNPGGLFASIGQMGVGCGVSPNPPNSVDNGFKLPLTDLYVKYISSPQSGFGQDGNVVEEGVIKKKRGGLKLKVKIGNPSLRRLVSGAVAGAVSRTAVAPLETIRTHLMVGSSGNSSGEVFHNIIKTDGWKGLFRGNLVNVIRVAPSKAIEGIEDSFTSSSVVSGLVICGGSLIFLSAGMIVTTLLIAAFKLLIKQT